MQHNSVLSRISFIVMLLLLCVNIEAADLRKSDLKELTEKASELLRESPDEAISLAKQVIEATNDDKNSPYRATALKQLGLAHYYKQNYRQAKEYNEHALIIYRSLNDYDGIGSVENNLGIIAEREGDYPKAIKKYTESVKMFDKVYASRKKKTIPLSNIGGVYSTLGRYDLALEALTEALENSISLKDTSGIAPSYNNIGNIYLSMEDFKSAINCYKKAEQIHIKYNEQEELSTVYNNIGEAYLNLKNIKKALKYNQLSLEIAGKIGDYEGIVSSHVNMSEICLEINESEQALAHIKEAIRLSPKVSDRGVQATIQAAAGKVSNFMDQHDEAISYYKKALEYADKPGFELLTSEIYAGLAEAYSEKKNFERAFNYLSRRVEVLDTLKSRENSNRLNMLKVSFEMEQTQRDNQLLRQQNIYAELAIKRQQTIRNLFIVISAIVLVSLAFLFLLYYSKKKKNELLALRNDQILNQKKELDKLYLEQYKLNEIKTKFFSIVAHDLKSPFQSLLGFTELLSKEYEHFDDEQRIDALNNMHKVTSDTYKLIENLLEWGRIQTGNATVNPKFINLKDLADSIAPMFEVSLKSKKLRLNIDIAPIILAHADQNMIGAVLRNLISNAIKFSNPDSDIRISAVQTIDSTRLSVTDSGVGIEPDVIDKLFTFDPKIRRTGTGGESGTGMGLGLCMEFMQLNKGTIKVSSQPGKGSTFTIIMQPGSKVSVPVTA